MSFENLSIVIPVINEAETIARAIPSLIEANRAELMEILIVTCERSTAEVHGVAAALHHHHPKIIALLDQHHPGLGGALRSGFEHAQGSHVAVLFGDMESDPATLTPMISAARRHPDAIISASRWIPGGGFEGYHPVKRILNRLFQITMRGLFGRHLTDWTFGYHLYPIEVARGFDWKEDHHPFVLESLLKPARCGVSFVEVPTTWHPRQEGDVVVTGPPYLQYLRVAAAVRLANRRQRQQWRLR